MGISVLNLPKSKTTRIMENLSDRRGFRQVLESIDADVRQELEESITAIVDDPTPYPNILPEWLTANQEALDDYQYSLNTTEPGTPASKAINHYKDPTTYSDPELVGIMFGYLADDHCDTRDLVAGNHMTINIAEGPAYFEVKALHANRQNKLVSVDYHTSEDQMNPVREAVNNLVTVLQKHGDGKIHATDPCSVTPSRKDIQPRALYLGEAFCDIDLGF